MHLRSMLLLILAGATVAPPVLAQDGGRRFTTADALDVRSVRVADVTADVPEVGKRSGMDAGKRTAVDLLGVEGARRRSIDFQESALAKLEGFGPEADWLRSLACEVSWKAF